MRTSTVAFPALLMGACAHAEPAPASVDAPAARDANEAGNEPWPRAGIGVHIVLATTRAAGTPTATTRTGEIPRAELLGELPRAKLLAELPACRTESVRCDLVAAPLLFTPAHHGAAVTVGTDFEQQTLMLELEGHPLDDSVFIDLELELRPPVGEREPSRTLRWSGGLATDTMTRLGTLTGPRGATPVVVYAVANHAMLKELVTWVDRRARP